MALLRVDLDQAPLSSAASAAPGLDFTIAAGQNGIASNVGAEHGLSDQSRD